MIYNKDEIRKGLDRLGRYRLYFIAGHSRWFQFIIGLSQFGLIFFNFLWIKLPFIPEVMKNELKRILAEIDHKVLNEVLPFNPTTELIAKHIYDSLKQTFKNTIVSKVTVWETEKSCCTYRTTSHT